jgi:anti-anti-sigma factor
MFNITLQNSDEIILSGRFDAAQVEKADQVLDQIQNDCTINFQDLAYISSAGLGSLLKIHVRLKDIGHSVKLKNLNKHIREVFKYSGLDKVFSIIE